MAFQIFLFNKTPLYLAVEKGNTDIVKLLLSNNDIKVNLSNILIHYILMELIDIYFILINKYFDCVFKLFFYKTPLYLAVEKDNLDIVKLLLTNQSIDVSHGCILI